VLKSAQFRPDPLRELPHTLEREDLANILVIEDDATFLDLLRVHLSGAGHQVRTAEDAAIGLRSVIADPPDIILLDIYVPYLDGFELLEALRLDPASRNTPVIVLTGRGDDDTYSKAQRFGVADYFTKPIQSELLLASIAKHVRERGPAPV
jgi:DNA-binding response OmpR family regulator